MGRDGQILRYTIDMPATIVWIALSEPEMISGWWGETDMNPRPGGHFRLRLSVPDGTIGVTGHVSHIVDTELVELSTNVFGTLRFRLEAVPGGSRGTSTLLTVELDSYPATVRGNGAPPAAVAVRWQGHMDDLVHLLQGHPVDWAAVDRRRTAGG